MLPEGFCPFPSKQLRVNCSGTAQAGPAEQPPVGPAVGISKRRPFSGWTRELGEESWAQTCQPSFQHLFLQEKSGDSRAFWNAWAVGTPTVGVTISSTGACFFCVMLQCYRPEQLHRHAGPSPAGCPGNHLAHLSVHLLQRPLHASRSGLPLKPCKSPCTALPGELHSTCFHEALSSEQVLQPFHRNAPVSLTLSHPLGVFTLSER